MASSSDGKELLGQDAPPSYAVANEDSANEYTPLAITSPKPQKPRPVLERLTTDQQIQQMAGSSVQAALSKPVIVSLERFKPDGMINPGRVRPGESIIEVKDAVLVAQTMTFVEMEALLYKRAKVREVMAPRSEQETAYSGVSLKVGGSNQTLINVEDEQGWEAARELLFEREGATLTYTLIIAHKDYAANESKRESRERRNSRIGGGKDQRDDGKRKEKCVTQ